MNKKSSAKCRRRILFAKIGKRFIGVGKINHVLIKTNVHDDNGDIVTSYVVIPCNNKKLIWRSYETTK